MLFDEDSKTSCANVITIKKINLKKKKCIGIIGVNYFRIVVIVITWGLKHNVLTSFTVPTTSFPIYKYLFYFRFYKLTFVHSVICHECSPGYSTEYSSNSGLHNKTDDVVLLNYAVDVFTYLELFEVLNLCHRKVFVPLNNVYVPVTKKNVYRS